MNSNSSAGAPETVIIGRADKKELRALLAQSAVRLNQLAEDLFADERFQTTAEAETVKVRVISAADLGFPEGATFQELVCAAQAQGLQLCPLELGPHLRLQFAHQLESPEEGRQSVGKAPPGSITVASEAPKDEDLIPWGFYLRRVGGELWLRGYRSWTGHKWAPEDRFVFVIPNHAA